MIEWVSKHIFATPLANKLYCVDVSGIGGKNMLLSRLAGQALGRSRTPRPDNYREETEKSAEVIVPIRNELWQTREVSQDREGLNPVSSTGQAIL
jgi:hypothetical protein